MTEAKRRLQPNKFGYVEDLPSNPDDPRHPYNLREATRDDGYTDAKLFELPLVKNHSNRANIIKVRVIENYVVCTFNPHGFLLVIGRLPDNGRPIPEVLACTFTTLDTVTRQILRYLEKI